MLRTWGALQNLIKGGEGVWLKSIHGGSMKGGLKMLSKNACDRVHLMVKLLAISSWKGALRFSEGGGGEVVFQMGKRASFLSGGHRF